MSDVKRFRVPIANIYVVLASDYDDLAKKLGRANRDIILSDPYHALMVELEEAKYAAKGAIALVDVLRAECDTLRTELNKVRATLKGG